MEGLEEVRCFWGGEGREKGRSSATPSTDSSGMGGWGALDNWDARGVTQSSRSKTTLGVRKRRE